jgi:predicted nucleic acid-binding protein
MDRLDGEGMNYTNDKCFVDTNIIIYAYDKSSDQKHQTACRIMKELWEKKNGILSPQVLQELFVTVTKKIPNPLNTKSAYKLVESLGKWELIQPNLHVILKAVEIHEIYSFSFWDALILSSAVNSGAKFLLSEDMHHGFKLDPIQVINPFR